MNVVAEYRRPGRENWVLVIGKSGETYPELEAFLKAEYPGAEVRPREADECSSSAAG